MKSAFTRHLELTAAGLLVGLLVLAWIRPSTPAGATMVLALVIIFVNAVGALVFAVSSARPAVPRQGVQKDSREP